MAKGMVWSRPKSSSQELVDLAVFGPQEPISVEQVHRC